MAATLWIVRRLDSNTSPVVDGVTTVIINDDDTTLEADVLTATVAAVQAGGIAVPDGYFDTADIWSAAGQLDADGDLIAFDQRAEVIA